MKVILDIDEDKWAFIEPMLSPYVIPEELYERDYGLLDFDEILKLEQGTRIKNVLKDGNWSSKFSFDGNNYRGEPCYSVLTFGDLRRVTYSDFMRHRNSGKKSWMSLKQYIENTINDS